MSQNGLYFHTDRPGYIYDSVLIYELKAKEKTELASL